MSSIDNVTVDMSVAFAKDLAGEIADIAGASDEVTALTKLGVAVVARLVAQGVVDSDAPGVGDLLRQAEKTQELLKLLDDPRQPLEAGK